MKQGEKKFSTFYEDLPTIVKEIERMQKSSPPISSAVLPKKSF